MGLRINSNIPALNAQRQTRQANDILNNAMRRMASGLRINQASDDAAGLAIAERFNTLARQFQGEIRNLQSGYNLAQTAEGGLNEQQDAVQRLRELAVQSANGTLSDSDRQALNAEAQQLLEQIDQEAADTEYNDINLLETDQTIPLNAEGSLQVSLTASTTQTLGLDTLDLSTAEGAAAAIETADAALTQIGENRATLGAQMNRFESAIEQRETASVDAWEAESRIRDADVALLLIERTRGQVRSQTGISALIQSNVTPQAAMRLLGS